MPLTEQEIAALARIERALAEADPGLAADFQLLDGMPSPGRDRVRPAQVQHPYAPDTSRPYGGRPYVRTGTPRVAWRRDGWWRRNARRVLIGAGAGILLGALLVDAPGNGACAASGTNPAAYTHHAQPAQDAAAQAAAARAGYPCVGGTGVPGR